MIQLLNKQTKKRTKLKAQQILKRPRLIHPNKQTFLKILFNSLKVKLAKPQAKIRKSKFKLSLLMKSKTNKLKSKT